MVLKVVVLKVAPLLTMIEAIMITLAVRRLLLLALLCNLPFAAYAQISNAGSISGTVLDINGAWFRAHR